MKGKFFSCYKKCIFAVGLFILIGLRFLFLSDASFVNDEANFIQLALEANAKRDWLTLGLTGAKGVKYGVATVYYFRFLLLFTHHPLWLNFLNTLVITGLMILSLSKLEKYKFEEFKVFCFVIFASPYLWFYGRTLWDNSLNFAVMGLALACYLEFEREKKGGDLFWGILLCNLGFHIHPMSLSLSLAMGLHFLVFNKDFVVKKWGTIAVILVFNGLLAVPYLRYFIEATLSASSSSKGGTLKSFLHPFLGFNLFNYYEYSYFLGKKWYLSYGGTVGKFLGYLVQGGTLLSAFFFVTSLVKKKSILLKNVNPFLSLSLLCILSQSFLNGTLKIYGHPHYYAMNWLPIAYLISLGMKEFPNLGRIYLASLITGLLSLISILHFYHGSRSLHYGVTLGNQWEVAKSLNREEAQVVAADAFHPKAFPHVIEVLRYLENPHFIQNNKKPVVLVYKNPNILQDGEIKIAEKK